MHNEAKRFARDDYDILLVGHEGHEEVVGTAGEAPDHVQVVDNPDAVDKVTVRDPNKVIWLSQTTLSVDETMETVRRLREKFPTLQDPPSDDICYATQNRQVAVKAMAPECDLVIVVGSANSSNSVRLVEVALLAGAAASHLVDYADDIDPAWLEGVTTVGVTSGASVPEILVRGVLDRLAEHGFDTVQPVTTANETLVFALPREIRPSALSSRSRVLSARSPSRPSCAAVAVGCGIRRGGRRHRRRGSAPVTPGDASNCRWIRWSGAVRGARNRRSRCSGGAARAARRRRAPDRRSAGGSLRGSRADWLRGLRRGSAAGGSATWPVLDRRGRSATGSAISVSGGRVCRDRDGVAFLTGLRARGPRGLPARPRRRPCGRTVWAVRRRACAAVPRPRRRPRRRPHR